MNFINTRNKFDILVQAIDGKLDVLLISEIKIDKSFPNAQFQINGYTTPYRLDRNCKGGGIFMYVREDIPSKQLYPTLVNSLEGFLIELNLRKKKMVTLLLMQSP